MIKPHLSSLVPFLKKKKKNDREIIRATTIWTLSKFSEWIVSQDVNFYKDYLSELLRKTIDAESSV